MTASRLSLFDLAPGKVLLERYEIRGPHRQSGMSAAFEVEDGESKERLEVQVFLGNLFEDRKQAAEFADRLAGWRGLTSSAVVALREIVVLDDGSVVYVSDFPVGETLRDWLAAHEKMAVETALPLASGVLGALVEIHEAGLVHGDIKPSSIYYDEASENAALVDGGVTPGLWAAKHLGTRTQLIGTPYYAPLEQFTGDSPDSSSDIYNVATVFYELLTGVLPWSGVSYVEVFQSKMMKLPPPMRERAPGVEVPSELELVISKALSGARRDRYVSAGEFLDQLNALTLS